MHCICIIGVRRQVPWSKLKWEPKDIGRTLCPTAPCVVYWRLEMSRRMLSQCLKYFKLAADVLFEQGLWACTPFRRGPQGPMDYLIREETSHAHSAARPGGHTHAGQSSGAKHRHTESERTLLCGNSSSAIHKVTLSLCDGSQGTENSHRPTTHKNERTCAATTR